MMTSLHEKKPHLYPGLDLGYSDSKCAKTNFDEQCSGMEINTDHVVLHTYQRVKLIPNVDVFSMKLETYMRISKIPYKLDSKDWCKGPKNTVPWIDIDGIKIEDSGVIMRRLNEMFKVDLNEHLSDEEKATAWPVQKWLEEYTYWLNYHSRWYMYWDDLVVNMFECPAALNKLIRIPARWWQKKQTKAVGIGKHTDEEVNEMIIKDLEQFAKLLGDKKFIMGDIISEVDCAAFGILSQIRWCTPKSCPGYQLLTGGKQQNVMDYLDRIKDVYWPDWEKICAESKC
ncbi:failed axon connections homolog isoform X2 [Ruditapes philippinarum]|uniref:failed axon connections homolog isoform X2 n=1 Tax=Ruditapes philippinarum TaxID=129788 RepID=UPI00295A8B75|nr:failed axon connections homolog isoform X2 [Ruditapes philippinarum]